jgi:hypothetical protein
MKFFNPRRISTAALAFALLNLNSNYALAQSIPLASVPAYTSDQLEKLVGPIALYPDDLISITLPATTYPLDIVKAQRFLEKLKIDNKAKPDASMPDPVLKLLNYPDIIKKMNDDLDWMQQLGEAVDTDEAAVLAAIQSFRRKAQSVGNLKSDDKQVIVVEKEVIVIKPANPEIIYVPTYQPSTVVTYSSTPYPYSYYPTPYPSYYYPYAPGAAFATGLIWGAAIGGAWNTNWSGGSINHNTNININNNNKNINTGANRSTSGGSNWRNSSAPTQTKAGAQTRQASAGTRPGDAQSGGSRQASAASANSAARSNASVNTAQSNRSTQQASARNTGGSTTSAGNMSSRSPQSGTRDNAFNGVQSSGASANRASTRGANSMSSPSARSASSGARSGGARSGGGRR